MNRPRVAAIVINSISHDTRIQKEARSLSRAGYDVTIYGVQDNRQSEAESVLPGGIRAVRVSWRGRVFRTSANLCLWLGLAGLMGLGVASFLGFEVVAFFSPYIAAIAGHIYRFRFFWASVFTLAVIFLPALYIFRTYWNLSRKARFYEQQQAKGADFSRWVAVLAYFGRLFPRSLVPNWARSMRNNPLLTWSELRSLFSFEGLADIFGLFTRVIYDKGINASIYDAILADDLKPEFIHCHDLNTLKVGHAVATRLNAKLIFDAHEIFEEVSMIRPLQRRRAIRIQRKYSGDVDGFISINKSAATYLNSTYPKFPAAIIVKNAAEQVQGEIAYDGRLHRAAGLPLTTKILLYQGGFSPQRGLTKLVKSAPKLPTGWVLVMMGWGPIEAELKKLATSVDPNGVYHRFIPAAPLPELPLWTTGASLGVIPYENTCLNTWFCTPNKLWEFPSAHVPFIASPFPEIKKIFDEFNVGRTLSDPVTPENIGEVVRGIDDDSLHQMKRNCATMMVYDNWDVYGKRLVAMYDRLRSSPKTDQPSLEAVGDR